MTVALNPEAAATGGGELQAPLSLPISMAALDGRRRRTRFRRWAAHSILSDVVAASLAAVAATLAARRWGVDAGAPRDVVAGVVVLTWPALLGSSGGYSLKASLSSVDEVRRLLDAAVRLLATAAVAHLAFGVVLPGRFLVALLPSTVLLTALGRILIRSSLSRARADWRSYRVLAVGPVHDIARFHRELGRSETAQLSIVAYLADDLPNGAPAPRELRGMRRLADRRSLEALPEGRLQADVLVRVGRPEPDEMWTLGRCAYDAGMTVAIAPLREDATTAMATSYVPLGPTPLLVVETPTRRPCAARCKSVFDRVMALLLIVLLAPVMAVIATTIAVRDGRPILFRQERVGRGGRRFTCLKFRTMATDAEERLAELRRGNDGCGPLFKLRDDPRVTPTGRWLRRRSLDELPQLFNVLKGEMSLIGPRPPLPSEVAEYDTRTARRLLVKPGITGLWQTQGRSDLRWEESVCLDLMYIDHWSPVLDLVTLVRTVKAVLRPTGAY